MVNIMKEENMLMDIDNNNGDEKKVKKVELPNVEKFCCCPNIQAVKNLKPEADHAHLCQHQLHLQSDTKFTAG